MPGVKVLYVSELEVNAAVEESKTWENALEVNGISNVHLVVSESDDRVELYTDDTKVKFCWKNRSCESGGS